MSERPQEAAELAMRVLDKIDPHHKERGGMSEQPQDVSDAPACPSCGLIDGLHRNYCHYASKQSQEWTPEKIEHPTDGFRYVVQTQSGDFSAHCLKCAKAIADAHNAALAAEREKVRVLVDLIIARIRSRKRIP